MCLTLEALLRIYKVMNKYKFAFKWSKRDYNIKRKGHATNFPELSALEFFRFLAKLAHC